MRDEWNHRGHWRKRRDRARRRHARSGRDEVDEFEDSTLTTEERAYRDARWLAERKVKVTGNAIKWAVVTLLLLVFFWPIGVIVLIFGAVSLMKDFYQLVLEPLLRKRFIEQEVEKQVRVTLSQERRTLEGEHARSMERLSASIAHEIRNPITAAKSLVQQMGEDLNAAENVEYARVALEELGRVERSVSHLLRFARDEEMEMAELRMAEVVDSALETFRDRVARANIALECQIDSDGVMTGDAEKLRRIVINLVSNAVDAIQESKTPNPRVEVHLGENLAGSEVWVRIKDNGPGIDREVQSKIFSPFYTSKANGTGLGLAISKKLVDAHGGSIELESEPGAGVEVVLSFPKRPRKEGALA